MKRSSPFLLGVILLGAGASSRMGKPKLLLPWAGKTVLACLAETWRTLGAAQIAVVASNDNAGNYHRAAPHIATLINFHPEAGMFSSIRCAASWNGWDESTSHFVIALGDQPHLSRKTLSALVEFARENPNQICQPSLYHRPRHPVILPRGIFQSLVDSKTETLREFLALHETRVRTREVEDIGLDLDMDTPADYERALQLWKAQSPES